MKLLLLTAVAALISLPAHAENALPVVASFSILGDMVAEIGGTDVSVKTIVGPNSDTHSYEPTPSDVRSVAHAKILFINGLGFEGWLPRLASATDFKGPIVTVSDGIKVRNASGTPDPHAWQDLSNGVIYARNIAKALTLALPTEAVVINGRAEAYIKKLEALNEQLKRDFGAIPPRSRKIMTSHDAFGYFGAAYGITFIAPVGLTTDAEPSAASLAALVEEMKHERIQTIFLENMTSPRLARQLAEEGGARVGEELFSDALSAPNGPAPTYITMFQNNAPKFLHAMQESERAAAPR
ncbi:MAG: zinc ABC transporter substrate-binding protein [Pseudomonadota bacterium]|nr:zinc ABC transporter substrate-binding protein [Pseudomonadota bacterium]